MRAFVKSESSVDGIELAEVAIPRIDDDGLLVRVKAIGVGLMTEVARNEKRVELERVYPFEEAPVALAKVRTRHARGKLVLSLE